MTHRSLHVAQILWPAFLVAGVLEMVVFSWVDPALFRLASWQPDSQTVYSLAFFVFWALVALSSMLSHWMMKSSDSTVAQERRQRRLARRQHHLHHHA